MMRKMVIRVGRLVHRQVHEDIALSRVDRQRGYIVRARAPQGRSRG